MASGNKRKFSDPLASMRFRQFGQINIELGAPAIDAERFDAGPNCPCGIYPWRRL
jgi:hypothetical protein